MKQLYLFATLAGARVAIAAEEVEAVVRLTDIAPVPGLGRHVAGLSALRSRVLTVIDVAALIHGAATPAERRELAIIADIGGHSYGLMVDEVSDICWVPEGALPLRGRLDPVWMPYARAIVEHEAVPWLLVSPSGFLENGIADQAA
ncbi:purine-binding chemotaxis protein CheW [Sphingobium wenxiniae]|jgi:purine-binding chemotaxis protein CheW|uniref:Chemotaxis protein n=2 Tax=Sphingobium TaxID=165695 RepID=T0I106_9SPHN|nr:MULTISPECIES: chemotaxis protein CheW [Sphingobium]EQB03404.1 chemotaxis protein [Sphingobium baderi LL03]KMS62595.1 chemotaxis protein [Sphingobium baderi LL03]MBB6190592.1 purine-binding chemotaxis protein CheW [Sphingobium wenxiniae]TWH94370.1 purine-binding chemotaxis protein CheW [Sphingobium wenxiniae]WRD76644.1 chemotaxis protein CheW [Sphingobium baderi]